MTLYSLVLFVHVTAVSGLSATLSFEVLSLFHLRRASTLTDGNCWIEPVPRLPLVKENTIQAACSSCTTESFQRSGARLCQALTSVRSHEVRMGAANLA